jgi:NAD(P)-dependent dehydrogenase (short-subunit alcohol dehydrogenase family)
MYDNNRVVIVTGAGGAGCARAVSVRFATGGAAVVVSDIDEAGGQDTVRLIERGGAERRFSAQMCATSHRSEIWFLSRRRPLVA